MTNTEKLQATKHTPTPLVSKKQLIEKLNYYESEADFIVRAVNSHESLLNTIEELLNELRFLRDAAYSVVENNALADLIDAVLHTNNVISKAEGK